MITDENMTKPSTWSDLVDMVWLWKTIKRVNLISMEHLFPSSFLISISNTQANTRLTSFPSLHYPPIILLKQNSSNIPPTHPQSSTPPNSILCLSCLQIILFKYLQHVWTLLLQRFIHPPNECSRERKPIPCLQPVLHVSARV